MTQWTMKELSGWGRFPTTRSECALLEARADAREMLEARDGHAILAHGMGRSYGDAALLERGRVLLTSGLDEILGFDPETGWLECEAGVTLSELIERFLPRGFFPPVLPGTQFVSVGGAIGCNIHGKNHHVDGCFGDHVRAIDLLVASGEIVRCSREVHPELFWATVGGMGLTGVILSAQIQLYRVDSPAIEVETVRVENLDHFFEESSKSKDFTHVVSWIDTVKRGKAMGRGVMMRGRHAGSDASFDAGGVDRLASMLGKIADGKNFESNAWLNRFTITAFNEAYFRKERKGTHASTSHFAPFFFPLDAVQNWNYVYGPRGFLQYQFVVPSRDAVRAALEEVTRSGQFSFLSVIKEFGDQDHGGLSFPCEGITLAMDFPNTGAALMRLFERLDDLVLEAGGRVYMGKDARLSRPKMRAMYPEWVRWKEVRDEWDPERVFQSDLGIRLGLV